MIDSLRWCAIVVLVVGQFLVFKWREARPVRWTVHLFRVWSNTVWCQIREKTALILHRK